MNQRSKTILEIEIPEKCKDCIAFHHEGMGVGCCNISNEWFSLRKDENIKLPNCPLQPPPHDNEAEQVVLGSVFLEKEIINSLEHKLNEKHFYNIRHKIIYTHMLELHSKDIIIDYSSLANSLDAAGVLNTAGGVDYMLGLTNSIPNISSIPHFIQVIKDTYNKRQMQHLCRVIIGEGYIAEDTNFYIEKSIKKLNSLHKE
jgi:replicative DNA helicase